MAEVACPYCDHTVNVSEEYPNGVTKKAHAMDGTTVTCHNCDNNFAYL